MSLQQLNIRNSVLILMIVAAAATRMLNLNHIAEWADFTPVGAVALFGGAYFTDKWKAYLVPLLTLLISDLLINYFKYNHTGLFGGAWVVYLSFAAMVFIGTHIESIELALKKYLRFSFADYTINLAFFASVTFASVISVAIHWLLTDIGPWLNSTLYAKGPVGYIQSLIAALFFEKNLLYGNLFFCALLFGGFELAKRKYRVLRMNASAA